MGRKTPKSPAVVLGAIDLKVKDELAGRSQITAWHTIYGGVGHGRLRTSIMFKALDVQLPREMQCGDVGLIEVAHVHVNGVPDAFVGYVKARLISPREDVVVDSVDVGSRPAKGKSSCASVVTQLLTHADSGSRYEACWLEEPPLRLPTLARTAAVVAVELYSKAPVKQSLGIAVIWASHIGHAEINNVEDVKLTPHAGLDSLTLQDEDDVPSPVGPTRKVKRRETLAKRMVVGTGISTNSNVTLSMQLRFTPGLAPDHRPFIRDDDTETREAYDVYKTIADSPTRPRPAFNQYGSQDSVETNTNPWDSSDDESDKETSGKSTGAKLKRCVRTACIAF